MDAGHDVFVRHRRRLLALHRPGTPLLLPNAWTLSARTVEAAGAAVATTSAGVAWALGAADGDHIDRDSVLALTARVVAAVSVPVTADIESGFGVDAADVGVTVQGVLAAGAVGANIEDVHPSDQRVAGIPGEQAERLAAARVRWPMPRVRCSHGTRGSTPTCARVAFGGRFADTIARAQLYLEAAALPACSCLGGRRRRCRGWRPRSTVR